MKRLLLLVCASTALSGCARLTVRVDIMDPSYLRGAVADARLLERANDLAAGGHDSARRFTDEATAHLRAFRDTCFEQQIAAANAAADAARPSNAPLAEEWTARAATLKTIRADLALKGEVETDGLEMLNTLIGADETVRSKMINQAPGVVGLSGWRAPLSPALKSAFVARQAIYDQQALSVRRKISSQRGVCVDQITSQTGFNATAASAASQKLGQAEQAAERAIDRAKMTSIVGGGVLLKDLSEAFFAVNAPKEAWAKRYNRAFGEGVGGSTSIAVKLNDTADFSIKGFVFDARGTAEMVKKVGVQAISVIAASYGAPFAMNKTDGSSSAKPFGFDPAQQISAAGQSIAGAEAQEQAYRSALFRIADSIVANWTELQKPTPVARDAVRSTFDAHKPMFVPAGQ